MTLEQKLIAGADATVVADHSFLNEPLQLSVSFENVAEQAAGEGKLKEFLTRNDFRAIESGSYGVGYSQRDVGQHVANNKDASGSNGFEYEAFYVGRAAQNFVGPSNSSQYLVRLKSERLGEVVNDLSTVGAEEVQLRVGNVRSNNTEQLWQLANQAAGTEFTPPSRERQQFSRLRRTKTEAAPVANGYGDKAALPDTAQWINALQAYGLLGGDNTDQSEKETQRTSGYGGNRGYAGGKVGVQSKGTDATTNGTPDDLAIAGTPMLEDVAKKQQTLLTLVIEFVNDQAPGKKEPPTKVKAIGKRLLSTVASALNDQLSDTRSGSVPAHHRQPECGSRKHPPIENGGFQLRRFPVAAPNRIIRGL